MARQVAKAPRWASTVAAPDSQEHLIEGGVAMAARRRSRLSGQRMAKSFQTLALPQRPSCEVNEAIHICHTCLCKLGRRLQTDLKDFSGVTSVFLVNVLSPKHQVHVRVGEGGLNHMLHLSERTQPADPYQPTEGGLGAVETEVLVVSWSSCHLFLQHVLRRTCFRIRLS